MAKHKQKRKSPQAGSGNRAAQSMSRRDSLVIAGLLGLVAFLLYLPTVGHDYALDDYAVIVDNQFTREGLGGIDDILSRAYWAGKDEQYAHFSYRPLSLITFALEKQLFGLNPQVGHLVNVALYGLTGALLFLLLTRLLSQEHPLLPLLSSLLFVVHPIHTEVVANIKSRDEILTLLFLLGAMYYCHRYFRNGSVSFMAGGCLMFLLALLSKESAVTFLIVIPWTLYFFAGSSARQYLQAGATRSDARRSLEIGLALLFSLALYLALRAYVLGGEVDIDVQATRSPIDNVLYGSHSLVERLATACLIFGKYFRLLLLPFPLVHSYSFGQVALIDFSDVRAIAGLVLFLAAVLYSVLRFKTRSVIAYAIVYYLITYAITSNTFILIGATMAERFMYVPSLGFCLFIAVVLLRVMRLAPCAQDLSSLRRCLKDNVAFTLLAVAVLAGYVAIGQARIPAWKNNVTLYTEDLVRVPGNPVVVAHYYIALIKHAALVEPGPRNVLLAEAIARVKRSENIYRADPRVHRYLGSECYFALGRLYQESRQHQFALDSFERARKLGKDNAKTHFRIGMINDALGEYQAAIESYRQAIDLEPDYKEAFYNLGNTYTRTGEIAAAIQAYLAAVQIDTTYARALANLGIVHHQLGNSEESESYLSRALRHDRSLESEIRALIEP